MLLSYIVGITLVPVQLRNDFQDDFNELIETMREFYAHERLTFRRSYLESAVKRLLEEPALGRIWWITETDQRVGYLVLTFSYSLEYGGKNALIDEFFVRAKHRGRGIGTQVLALADRACADCGAGVIYLEADRTNVPAQALYRRHGFIDKDRFLLSKRLPGDGLASASDSDLA